MNAVSELRALGASIPMSFELRALYQAVLEREDFANGIASASHHPLPHREPGGLALHTLEVARFATEAAGEDSILRARAFVAAVYHDLAKALEYEQTTEGTIKTKFANWTGHIVGGWFVFVSAADGLELPDDEIDEIGHALLAHHGRREWGSPVTPQTELARILHAADLRSARGE